MNKVNVIVAELRQELLAGKYASGSRFPSEHSLMKRFCTSRVTVNKVTSVLVTERFLTRGPHGAGTYVCEGKPFPLGHLAYVGVLRHPYYIRLLEGIQRTAFSRNYAVSCFAPEKEMINYCLECLSQGAFQGVLATGIGKLPDSFPLPVVYLDNVATIHAEGLSVVSCDNVAGAYEMGKAVLAKGHRDILVYSCALPVEYSREKRIRGFCQALREAGIADWEQRVFHSMGREPAMVKNQLEEMRKNFPDATAILTDSDDLTMSVWKVLKTLGLQDKFLLTGFGNVATISGVYDFPTVEQNPEEIGARSVEELLRAISQPEEFTPREIMVETELVNGDKIVPVSCL